MRDYIKIEVVGEGQTDKYLTNGWEIIETVKKSYDGYGSGDTRLEYHLGLPSRVMIDRLTAVIKEYEKYGFKDLLFEKVAEDFGENISDYEAGGGRPTYDKTPSYIVNYERTVNNNDVSLYKKISFKATSQEEQDIVF